LPVVPEQRLIRVADGVDLAVREHPPVHSTGEARPVVVLVHGLASTSRLWDGVAASLARAGHRVVAVDLRGHGESDAPGHGYDTATAAADLIALIPQVSDEPVLLAGQSWGGNVVLQLAARRPDLVCGLALVDGGWISLRGRFARWEDALAVLTPPDIDGVRVDEFERMVAQSLAGFPDGAVEAATSVVRITDEGTVQRRLTVERHLQILRSMWDDDPAAWYTGVQAPTVLMPAVTGGDVPAEVTTAAAALPQARLRVYRDAHHDVHLQRPDEVADDIRSLL
jgi:pimeloyl-ACP methyl ester carboxylesterase